MLNKLSIEIVINCHHEGKKIFEAVKSVEAAVLNLLDNSKYIFEIQKKIIADQGDSETLSIIRGLTGFKIYEVQFGDLGQSRNFAAQNSNSEYITFLDADDQMGSNWLLYAVDMITNNFDKKVVLHPEFLVFKQANQPDSVKIDIQFSQNSNVNLFSSFFIQNHWASAVFASRRIFLTYPYVTNDFENKYGWEDWTWNQNLLTHSIKHLVVQNSYYTINLSESSLSNFLKRELFVNYHPVEYNLFEKFLENYIKLALYNKISQLLNFLFALFNFRKNFYMDAYSDLAGMKYSPFLHFIKHGFWEGRIGNKKIKLRSDPFFADAQVSSLSKNIRKSGWTYPKINNKILLILSLQYLKLKKFPFHKVLNFWIDINIKKLNSICRENGINLTGTNIFDSILDQRSN
jgi:glycosyltransferase involved in cell wall biosynthesis